MSTQTVSQSLLNFRKMRHEFAQNSVKDGKALLDKGAVTKARVTSCTAQQVVIEATVIGQFRDVHRVTMEILRHESEIAYSSCDCPRGVDCQHLACLLLYLENHFHTLLLEFLEERSSSGDKHLQETEKKLKEKAKKDRERELVKEFSKSGLFLARSSLFRLHEKKIESGELMIFIGPVNSFNNRFTEVQLAVKLLGRAKPVLIQQPRFFLQAVLHSEPVMLGTQRAVLSDNSFGEIGSQIVPFLRREFEYYDKQDRAVKAAFLPEDSLYALLSQIAQKIAINQKGITCFYETFERAITFSDQRVQPSFSLELLQDIDVRLAVRPYFEIHGEKKTLRDVKLMPANVPGVLINDTYYLFHESITLKNALDLQELEKWLIPEPLFSTFATHSLPCLEQIGQVLISDEVKPYLKAKKPIDFKTVCSVELRDGELSSTMSFRYKDHVFPEIQREHTHAEINMLKSSQGVTRNPLKELFVSQQVLFGLMPEEGGERYTTKSEKKIAEFITETIPTNKETIEWNISESLKSLFSFETSNVHVELHETRDFGRIGCKVSVEGPMKGVEVVRLQESCRLKRPYVEGAPLPQRLTHKGLFPRKLVIMSQEEMESFSTLADDFSFSAFQNGEWTLPLWSIVGVEEGKRGENITVSFTPKVRALQHALLFPPKKETQSIPKHLDPLLRPYQKDGVVWLRRLREFGLGGILADDMGLGKTIQTIVALSEVHKGKGKVSPSLIICPTSLVDNWKEEINRFDPSLDVLTFVGAPGDRRKLLAEGKEIDVIITSYGLIQKDVELFEPITFSYLILDEAQAIKNRETRNARTVKKLQATYRLVLTGTPLENSLEDLWSLFDFLMPGFLSTHDRFVQTYMKSTGKDGEKSLDYLRKRIGPFVLRRMKTDVLEELLPITHFVYHCNLHDEQQAIYEKAAKKAREDLTTFVQKEGFEKARLHVLAILTKLKQICCHPSIVAIDKDEKIRSAKYEMFQDLLMGLVESGHKTVVFSQYTRMLAIMKQDLTEQNVPFLYLDGSTKNRLSLVKEFNERSDIPVFLVSLRAGGNGLNLVGADSVIHYDMWWNPAVEAQATDRVWRMGQKLKVSSYKLITKDTVEEKIMQLQERKKDLISELIMESDEDLLTKLTWEDVLGILTV